MQILLNGQPEQIADDLTMDALIERLELGGKRIAVEVNAELVPRSRFADHRLNEGDRVEIVHAIGGG